MADISDTNAIECVQMSTIDYRVHNTFTDINNNEMENLDFLCVYLNIRSLRKNWDLFLCNINKIIRFVKIIILVETNICDDENRLYQLDGFNTEFINRQNRNGGGIAMYVRKEIAYERIDYETTYYENIQIQIKGKKEWTILAIYRPPKLSEANFIEEMENQMNSINRRQNIIVMGDININIDVQREEELFATRYLDMINSKGLQNIALTNTRVDLNRGSSTTIDHCLVRSAYNEFYAATVETNISDHYTLMCGVPKNTKDQSKTLQKTILSDNRVHEQLSRIDWSILENATNVDDYYEKIVNIFNGVYEKSRINIKIRKREKQNPWMTVEIMSLCKERDKLYNKWKNNRRCMSYETQYKSYRNFVNKRIQHVKSEYYKNRFAEYRKDPKNTWRLINNILGKTNSNIDEIITRNFQSEANADSIANKFATRFTEEIKSIIHSCDLKTYHGSETSVAQSMYLEYVSDGEIGNIISKMSVNKSPGIDNIRAKDFKYNASALVPVTTQLVNKSLEERQFPKKLKIAFVRPIYKSGKKDDPANYRPISILPVLDKIMEEVMANRLQDYIAKYKIVNKNQYGFLKNRNVNQLLREFANTINTNLNKNHHSLVIFIDFKKAFDTLCHKRIIRKLEKIGIRGGLLDWFASYLCERSFKVKVSNCFSNLQNVELGVPQGSILGPLLFILYANDMLSVLRKSIGFQYADDTAIVVSNNNIDCATETMQAEFDNILSWCHDNGLIVNVKKTKLIHIRPPHIVRTPIKIRFHSFDCLHKNQTPLSLTDNCTEYIDAVNVYRYLGVEVDYNFKWDHHIKYLCKRLRQAAYALYHLSNYTPFNVLMQAYYSLVESVLQYGIIAWGNAAQYRIMEVQRAQNRIFRILLRAKYGNRYFENSIDDLNLLTVKKLFLFNLINETYSDQRFKHPIDHEVNTRQRAEGLLKIPRINNAYGKQQLSYAVPSIFNQLPRSLWNIQAVHIRKKKIKKYLLMHNINL